MAAEKKPTRSQVDKARLEAEKRFSGRDYVTGVDVGYKWTDGKPTTERCVRVHVREKLPTSALEAAEIFPEEIDGVPLDVIQGHYRIRLATSPSDHQRRLPFLLGGISVGHRNVTAGTIGALVIDLDDGSPSILSNWHVLAGPTASTGDAVLQPGRADGGVPGSDTIAHLHRSVLDRDGDAAIARLTGSRQWLPMVYGPFDVFSGARLSKLGETLEKSGRTTAQTKGRVDGEGVYFLEYQTQPGVFERHGISGFKIVHEPGGAGELSSGGDSGSVWYNATSKEAVGLHFAGEVDPDPTAEHAIACNMPTVMDRLNIRFAEPADLLTAGAEAAVNNASMQGAGVPAAIARQTNAPEFTPRPDDPWDPWGPGWPWGPVGPWGPPWGPRGPLCPQCVWQASGEIPWPLWARSWGGTPPIGLGQAIETAKTTSRSAIWTKLKSAMQAKDPRIGNPSRSSLIADHIFFARHGPFLADAVNNHSPSFHADGIKCAPRDFRNNLTFEESISSIQAVYEEQDWSVSNA